MNKNVLVIIGENAEEKIRTAIAKLGFDIVILSSEERLAYPISSHADMLICVIGSYFFCDKNYYSKNKNLFDKIESFGYSPILCDIEYKKTYPFDIQLNQAIVGNYIIGKKDACAKEILNFASNNEYTYISVKQGYAKCSSLILNEKAIVCADDRISSSALTLGIDVLKIENSSENIVLNGYNYGFIGGASAVYNNTVFFFGDVSKHKNYESISAFCEKHGFNIKSLADSPLTDVGGAFFLPKLNNN